MPRSIAVEAARASLEARRAELVASADGEADGVATSPHSEPSAAARDAGAAPRGSRDGPASDASLESEARARAREAALPSLRAVLNATGVIVHTNLGRAPLAGAAVEAAAAVGRGYSTLEYDVASGARGSRQTHVESLVRELTGAEAALVVNNCAAAALLAATALAAGREIVVSRGQLVEIGGSFRVPDVVASSGARLVEVGTTNRTRFSDYERAVGPETGALMRVHPSNFRTVGFVEEVGIEELCELGRRSGVPVIDDAGSGALARGVEALGDEPDVRRSVAAGSAVVCFSGDKLLGGPQAGVMAGTSAAIERCRTHPLARALRIDKLSLAALEATLRLLRDPEAAAREVPVLAMLSASEQELNERAERLRAALAETRAEVTVQRGVARVGGGALPLLELEGPVCAVAPHGTGVDELAARLRSGEPPVVARVAGGRLLLDPRTLDDAGADAVAAATVAALSAA